MTLRDLPRLSLVLMFLAAAPQKILNPAAFVTSLESYLFLPDILVHPVALILPWLEIILLVMLLTRFWLGPALALSNLLLLVFLAALISAQVRGIDLDCGCFSTGTSTSNMTWYIVRDLVFLGLGLAATWLEFGHLPGAGARAEVTAQLLENDAETSAQKG